MAKAYTLDEITRANPTGDGIKPYEPAAQVQKLQGSEVLVQIGILGKEPYPCPRPRVRRWPAIDFRRAACRENQPEEHFDGRGLAGAIRPEKTEDFVGA